MQRSSNNLSPIRQSYYIDNEAGNCQITIFPVMPPWRLWVNKHPRGTNRSHTTQTFIMWREEWNINKIFPFSYLDALQSTTQNWSIAALETRHILGLLYLVLIMLLIWSYYPYSAGSLTGTSQASDFPIASDKSLWEISKMTDNKPNRPYILWIYKYFHNIIWKQLLLRYAVNRYRYPILSPLLYTTFLLALS